MSALTYRHEFKAMASHCEVVLAGVSAEEARRLSALAEAEVLRIEHKYSRYRPASLLSVINRSWERASPAMDSSPVAAITVPCDAETLDLLDKAELLYQHSGGLFDITSGVLRRAWNFQLKQVPEPQALQALLPLINWPAVVREGDTVALPVAGMELDFGGFGKEYAADRAAAVLLKGGVHSGYVNLAGDMHILGPKPNGEPWSIGIRHPRHADRLLASIPVSSGALATSGDYERYFEKDGKRYCHILNPRTGYPASYWQSVSVLAPNTLIAGSFSTIAMLMEEKALDFLHTSGLSFLAVDQEGRIHQESQDA
ncbi:MAG: FAD:protein FMN transferase [Gammaproteobacteria bacterium]|nr:FAD:protein FMN transferase [Gammaproteobacteria bacterium]